MNLVRHAPDLAEVRGPRHRPSPNGNGRTDVQTIERYASAVKDAVVVHEKA